MSTRILLLLVPITIAAACSDASTAPLDANQLAASATGPSAGSSGGATDSRTILEAALRPESGNAFQRASGKAKWKMRDASRRELEIQIEDMVAGTRVNFFVGGVQYGDTQTVDSLGAARIELSTQLGQQVPASVQGQRVEVKTEAGDLVVAGSF